ncbi:MAG TPA: CopG family transcriptional regulator [Gemmataceae bacterium]|nr:CopG family transcriptional regulator [Gemmataceae bacterium]
MKPRHHLYLDDALSEELDRLAQKPGSSKSGIVADALRAYLTRGAAKEADTVLKTRLDRFARAIGRLERNQEILLETLALFIRWELTVTAPLAESEQAAARASGEARFQSFVDQLGRRIASGRGLSGDLRQRLEDGEAIEGEGAQ